MAGKNDPDWQMKQGTLGSEMKLALSCLAVEFKNKGLLSSRVIATVENFLHELRYQAQLDLDVIEYEANEKKP